MTYVSLYRRFRPQTFTEVVGQDHVTRTLRNAIAAGRTSHAYLFSGPRGTGKTTVAKVLSKALNCKEGPTPDPCCRCEACIRIQDGYSMDVIEIDAASNRGIDEIRDLREKVKFAPVEERYKVYIIDEVHMLTQEAFNALLKTLEEPPQRVVFILATTEPHRVLPTILSRCQRFDFRRLTVSELSGQVSRVAEAEGIELSEDAVRLIATGAQGAARDALGLLEQCAAYTGGKITYDDAVAALGVAGFRKVVTFCDTVIKGNLAAALTIVRELIDSGHDPALFLRDVLEHFRNLLVLQTCGFHPNLIDTPEAALSDLKRQAGVVPRTVVLDAIDILSDADSEMKYSASPQLTTEVITIKLVYLQSPSEPESQTVQRQAEVSHPVSKTLQTEGLETNNLPTKNLPAKEPHLPQERLSADAPTSGGLQHSEGLQQVGSQGTSPATEVVSNASSQTKNISEESSSAEGRSIKGRSEDKPVEDEVSAVRPVDVSFDEIKANWGNVISALKPGIEKTLYYKDGIPVALNENELVISFQDDVRKELASEKRRRKNIQDAVKKVFGVKLSINFTLSQEPNKFEFQLEPGISSSEEKETFPGDVEGEYSQEPGAGGVSEANGSDSEGDEEEVGESLRRTREAVREHPTVKTALSVFKGRIFKIDV